MAATAGISTNSPRLFLKVNVNMTTLKILANYTICEFVWCYSTVTGPFRRGVNTNYSPETEARTEVAAAVVQKPPIGYPSHRRRRVALSVCPYTFRICPWMVVRSRSYFTSNGIPVFREISSKSSTTGRKSGIPFLLLIASASRSGSPGISGPLVPGAGLVFRKT